MSPLISHLAAVFHGLHWIHVVLWVGLVLLTGAMVALMWTRWGQSQLMSKCTFLSLVLHSMLATYAATVQIVTGGSPSFGLQDSAAVNVRLADVHWTTDTGAESEAGGAAAGQAKAAAWDAVASAPLKLASAGPEPLAMTAAPMPIEPSAHDDAMPATQTLSAFRSPDEENRALPQKAAANEALPVGDAPPIETPAPERVQSALLKADENAGPQEVAGAPSTHADDHGPALTDVAASASPNLAATSLSADHGTAKLPDAPAGAGLTPVNGFESSAAGSDGPLMTARGAVGAANKTLDGPAAAASPERGVPNPYKLRVAGDHTAVAQALGGSAQTEAAVKAALKWLAANQENDGRWNAQRHGAGRELKVLGQDRQGAGAKADTGMTGLALLAMLGAGNTHTSGDYQETVAGGLNFLLRVQAADGNLGGEAEPYAFMYCHGMATLALSEAYGMTGDERLKLAVRRAIGYTVAAQNPSTGGWRYRPHESGDMSQLGWQLMALRSANLTGITLSDQTRQGMVRFIQSISSGPHGGLGSYRPGERPTRTMTAEALACRQMLGMARENPAGDEAAAMLLGELPGQGQPNLYYWYYGTMSLYQLQGEAWQTWNQALTTTLVSTQRGDGELAGTWDPDVWGGYGGRVFTTAMGTMCLEVYYRFLPLYAEAAPLPLPLR